MSTYLSCFRLCVQKLATNLLGMYYQQKNTFLVTLRPLGSMREGKAELHVLKLPSVFHHLPSLGRKQFCALLSKNKFTKFDG